MVEKNRNATPSSAEKEEKTMGINYATYLLKEKIVKEIQQSNLPIVNIHFVLNQVLSDVTSVEQSAVLSEKNNYESNEK